MNSNNEQGLKKYQYIDNMKMKSRFDMKKLIREKKTSDKDLKIINRKENKLMHDIIKKQKQIEKEKEKQKKEQLKFLKMLDKKRAAIERKKQKQRERDDLLLMKILRGEKKNIKPRPYNEKREMKKLEKILEKKKEKQELDMFKAIEKRKISKNKGF